MAIRAFKSTDFDKDTPQAQYLEDLKSTDRGTWVKQSRDARCFMNKDFTPLQEDGLLEEGDPKTNPIVKFSSLPEKIRFLKGRVFSNPIQPQVEPHENIKLEEPYRMVADAVFRHEMRDERGWCDYKLLEEIDKAITDGMVDGECVTNHIVDDSLRDEFFLFGKPVHYRLDPQCLVHDKRANCPKEDRRRHILHYFTEDEALGMFPKLEQLGKGNLPPEMRDEDVDEDLYVIIETQEKIRSWSEKINIPMKVKDEFGFSNEFIDKNDFKNRLQKLKDDQPDKFNYVDVDSMMGQYGSKSVRKQEWQVYSTWWAFGIDEPLVSRKTIGTKFSTEVLQFMPNGYGFPFFLRDLQAVEIVLHTILTRVVRRLDNEGGFFDLSLFTEKELDKLKGNKVGEWIGVKLFGQDIRQAIMRRDMTQAAQLLTVYLGMIQDLMNNMFGTWREQMGQAAFAGQSGELGKVLQASGTFMFLDFVRKIEDYLSRVFDRVLHMALSTFPPETLIIIAGESFLERKKVIADGTIYKRMKKVNAAVTLDLTTEADRNMFKQMVAQGWAKGVISPLSAFRELGFKEPERLAREMSAYMAQQSKAQAYAQATEARPGLDAVFDNAIKEYDTIAGNTQKS